MQIVTKLKFLKIVLTLVTIVFIIILLIYLGFILPEYLACDKLLHDGENGIDIWGSEVDCHCESKAFGEAFFQLFSIIIFACSVVLITFYVCFRKLKRKYDSKL
ncbi:MAG: hypothetical protein C0525_05455 [Flavobacterium sp.]|jgi:hypothetical protein|nr:hypothetical protein [Flavobacterium sp.]